jgi:ribosomal protein L1
MSTQLTGTFNQAQATVKAVIGEDAVIGAAVTSTGYWWEANVANQTTECELFIATQKDRKQGAALHNILAPRERMPKPMTARESMDRKIHTKRGRAACCTDVPDGVGGDLFCSSGSLLHAA